MNAIPSPLVEPPTKLLRLRDVKDRTGVSHSTIYRWMDAGEFPRPIKLSEACVRWREADLNEWIERRASQGH